MISYQAEVSQQHLNHLLADHVFLLVQIFIVWLAMVVNLRKVSIIPHLCPKIWRSLILLHHPEKMGDVFVLSVMCCSVDYISVILDSVLQKHCFTQSQFLVDIEWKSLSYIFDNSVHCFISFKLIFSWAVHPWIQFVWLMIWRAWLLCHHFFKKSLHEFFVRDGWNSWRTHKAPPWFSFKNFGIVLYWDNFKILGVTFIFKWLCVFYVIADFLVLEWILKMHVIHRSG